MGKEIERKFLVNGIDWKQEASTYLCQGYLNREKERTVRIRISGHDAFITVKGITTGASRSEFEYPIPAAMNGFQTALCVSHEPGRPHLFVSCFKAPPASELAYRKQQCPGHLAPENPVAHILAQNVTELPGEKTLHQ